MYFHTDNSYTLARLGEAVTRADAEGTRFRVRVDSRGRLSYKVGGGMWSEFIESTDDPFRDRPDREA